MDEDRSGRAPAAVQWIEIEQGYFFKREVAYRTNIPEAKGLRFAYKKGIISVDRNQARIASSDGNSYMRIKETAYESNSRVFGPTSLVSEAVSLDIHWGLRSPLWTNTVGLSVNVDGREIPVFAVRDYLPFVSGLRAISRIESDDERVDLDLMLGCLIYFFAYFRTAREITA